MDGIFGTHNGDRAGTQLLIEVLLLYRRTRYAHVIAGIAASFRRGLVNRYADLEETLDRQTSPRSTRPRPALSIWRTSARSTCSNAKALRIVAIGFELADPPTRPVREFSDGSGGEPDRKSAD
ncbi:hypothetical protein A4R44_04030 [Amycolatopsis sp. M39]|nr:hypothetical protein A4R44_04030 [Amycolatopsis sp. M39]